jgi:hypothetical protein
VQGSTKRLQIDPHDHVANTANLENKMNSVSHFECTQTGYKTHVVGLSLYYFTVLTFFGWSAVLGFLTIQYYVLYGATQLDKRTLHFEDELQLLKTFIVTWSIGFVWCFALKWPSSIKSLFLRRCPLKEATHVAVFLNNGQEAVNKADAAAALHDGLFVKRLQTWFAAVFGCINSFMAFLFSDTDWHLRKQGVFEYCKVKRDADGTRSFNFVFRRYNFCNIPNAKPVGPLECAEETASAEEHSEQRPPQTDSVEENKEHENRKKSSTNTSSGGVFIPGSWPMAETLSELLQLGNNQVGLTDKDIKDRYRAVGLNTIEMIKPTYLYVSLVLFSPLRPF